VGGPEDRVLAVGYSVHELTKKVLKRLRQKRGSAEQGGQMKVKRWGLRAYGKPRIKFRRIDFDKTFG
jgi:hypothetical protein